MKKEFDFSHKEYTGDDTIRRGYDIYDEWTNNRFSSRKVVSFVGRVASSLQDKRSARVRHEALSCLFALDMRIKIKYNTIFKCLFSYFSWRREAATLNLLRDALDIPAGVQEIRAVIEVELQKLRERLENEEADGDDEGTRGGKRSGKSEEEVVVEGKETEELADKNNEAEELADKEETKKDSEEKEEIPIEETQQEEAKEEIGEKEETAEPQEKEAETTATDENEELVQESNKKTKEENNIADIESEPSIDKKAETKSYNDAVDFIPIHEETPQEENADKRSFIDEMIIDDMVKGDKNIIGYRRIDEAERNREPNTPQDTIISQNEENKNADKDASLYDKNLATDKDNTQHTDKLAHHQDTGKATPEQSKDTIQNNANVNSTEQEFKPLSEMLQTDNPNLNQENKIANDLNNNMSIESKLSYVQMQEEMLREHMSITLEELGINDKFEVVRVSEPDAVSPPSVTQNRK